MIEEKLEVALVQIEIYRAIEESTLGAQEKSEWLAKLEKGLMTISDVSRSLSCIWYDECVVTCWSVRASLVALSKRR